MAQRSSDQEQIKATREYIALIRKTHPSDSLTKALDDLEGDLEAQEARAAGRQPASV